MRTTAVLDGLSLHLEGMWSVFSRKTWRVLALRYVLGLILLVRFRSISELARHLAQGGVDRLHHFLHDSPWHPQDLQRAMRCQVGAASVRHGSAILIVDDTPVERKGKHIEGLGIHHSAKGLVKGLCAVTAIVVLKGVRLAFAALGYRPKRSCPKAAFRSKVDLALSILTEAAEVLPAQTRVLLDSWYACKTILNTITAQGWSYVAAIRCNRRLIVDGRNTSVRALAKGRRTYQTVRLSKKQTVRVAKRIVTLPGIGEVALFITKISTATKFLVANDLALSNREAVELYAQRWEIETFHREIKQHLGFKELWMRSWMAVQRHWTLCLIAHNALQGWCLDRPSRCRPATFGETVRQFRRRTDLKSAQNWCGRRCVAA